MPAVTLEELWRLALPQGTTLAAGGSGLGREITWPALLRSRPPAFDPLRGGEIALVSLRAASLLDERLTLVRIIHSLMDMGVAAVAVAGEVDDEARQIAETAGLPLLVLPPGSNMHSIEQSITRTVIERRAEIYQRGQEIYQQLTELVIAERGVPAIAERLAVLTGQPVTLEDESLLLRVYAATVPPNPSREALTRALEEGQRDLLNWLRSVPPSASDPPTAKFALPALGIGRLVAPIVSRDKVAGYLSILGRDGELGELERLAVSRGAAACAIEMVKEWAVIDAEDRLQVDLIDALLSEEFTSAEALQMRAKRLGLDLTRPFAVFVLQAPASADASWSRSGLDKMLERELANRGVFGLVGTRGEAVTVLYPIAKGSDPAAVKAIAGELARAVGGQGKNGLSVGIGRLHPGLEGIRAAFREAQQALAMGGRLFGPGRTTYFGDLGLYRLLFGIKDTRDLQAFYEETLARLVAYDGRSDGELVKTLGAYFASHASPTDAARRLHLHRNTLLYRLRRIQEITGADLDDAEVCLGLHLALRVKDVLRAMPGFS